MAAPESGNTVNVLWTGGWDSTFRVLSLISDHDCFVQPHYIIDRERWSWKTELATIDRIIERCAQPDHVFKGRLLRPKVEERDAIADDPEMTAKFQELLSRDHLGSQGEWLTRFVKQKGLRGLQLCIHRNDATRSFLAGQVREKPGFPTSVYVLAEDVDPALSIFEDLEFPLLDLTKQEMREIATRKGFLDILELSWFCHRPLRGPATCGTCTPCSDAIAQGMGHRVGWRGHLRYHTLRHLKAALPEDVKRLLRPAVQVLRRSQRAKLLASAKRLDNRDAAAIPIERKGAPR